MPNEIGYIYLICGVYCLIIYRGNVDIFFVFGLCIIYDIIILNKGEHYL